MAVCISGMHRSGTSMVTNLLHLCGLYLGQEHDLMSPASDNPDGFRENLKFVEINEEILNEFGGGWDYPPPLPNGWHEEKEILRLRAKAKTILQEFVGHEPWGWKDPRNSLTLPFWMALIPDIKSVVCLRNPLEVALSLHKRNGVSYAFGLTLWKTYYQRILNSTSAEDRIITHYDVYFHDPRAELSRVLDFLNVSVSPEAIDRCLSTAAIELRHNRFAVQHLLDADISPVVVSLYVRMCEEAGWIDGGVVQRGSKANDSASEDIGRWLREWDDKGGQTLLTEWRDEGAAAEGDKTMPEASKPVTRVGRLDRSALEAELLRREREVLHNELRRLEAERQQHEAERQQHEAENNRLATRNQEILARNEKLRSQLQEILGSRSWRLLSKLDRIRPGKAERLTEQVVARNASMRDLREQPAAIHSQPKKTPQERKALRSALAALPVGATVIVVSEGDDDLLELDDRKGWHFPQTEDGAYADYPANSVAAIAHLEVLRAKGGDYLLFPSSALWWLEYYEGFKQHLESRYQVVVRQEDTCVVFALRQPMVSENAGWRTKFEEVVTECRARLQRDPAILDWNTGLELAATFPQRSIFSPPSVDRVLPYFDQSIDIVVVSSPDAASITEARRVAKAAVITVTGAELSSVAQVDAESNPTLVADWQIEGETAALPAVSIVIPTYNGITHTETCLTVLRETLPPNFRGEIIVVDDASTDETPDVLERWASLDERCKVLRNPKNAGFVTSCNRGASCATGEIIIFLNNDTIPLPGWLVPMLQIFHDYPDAGAVGGKLVYPNGRLQEAGGVIFADGSGANFGWGDYEVDAPLYNYMREVDYCSGALLATRRSLFQELGGFDTRYCPAYYEDTDYCFAVREKGFRVYYQPESTIIHLEGATSGTDLSSGVKRYQVVNQTKFVEKWGHVLKRQRPRPDRYDRQTWYALAARHEPDGAESG